MNNRKIIFNKGTPLRVLAGVAVVQFSAVSAELPGADPEKLPPVVVTGIPALLNQKAETASRLGLTVGEVPASVSSISRAEIAARGFRTVQDAVESVAGMQGALSPGNGATYSTRGFTGDSVNQLHDGFRIVNPAMSARPLDAFNYDRIEVLKGPSSVLYGEGAVGATINYVSKQPDTQRFTGETLLSYGSFNSFRFGAGVGGPIAESGLSYRLDYSRNSSDTFIENAGTEMDNLSASLRYDVSEQFHLLLSVQAMRDDVDAYWGAPTLADGSVDRRIAWQSYNVQDSIMKSESIWIRLKAGWNPDELLSVNNTGYVYLADRDWKNGEGYDYDPAAGLVTIRDLGVVQHSQNLVGDRLEASHEHEVFSLANKLSLGGEFSRNDFFRLADFPGSALTVNAYNPQAGSYATYAGAPGTRGADYEIWTGAVFLEDQLSILENLKIVGGFRYDHIAVDVHNNDTGAEYGKDFDPVSGRAGLVYEPLKGTTTYFQWSNSANTPRSLVNQNRPFTFDLEKTSQLEVGVKQSAFGGRLEGTAALFHITRDRVLAVGNPRSSLPDGEFVSMGGEFEIRVRPVNEWVVGANATVLSSEIEDSPNGNSGMTPANVAREMASVFTSYEFPIGLELGAGLRYVGKRFATDDNRFEMGSYFTLDLHATYRWKQWEFTVRGRNVTDEFYAAWSETDYYVSRPQLLVGAPASVEGLIRFKF